ncbi:MAG: sulfatase-like hydrolase/transferase [Phycisphaerae bacterium]|nr:sulfatase-like hydrolase/transferase [Phycisphaerae bacterium]
MAESTVFSRRAFLRGLGAASVVAGLGPSGAEALESRNDNVKKPNLLVIVTDQQSAGMMSCAGNRWLKTPAMDSLAATGMRFEQAYVTNPVSLPSRFSLLTGLYPSAIGVRHNGTRPTDRVKDMPARSMGWLFRKAGYETAYGGKVHLPGPMRNVKALGFDVIARNERDGLADACVTFIRTTRAKPFLLLASFINPHDICYMAIRDHNATSGLGRNMPKPMFEAMKPPAGVSRKDFVARHCPPLPANFEPPEGESEAVTGLLNLRPFRMNARKNWTADKWRIHRYAYCRLTERVDRQIGKVLGALRKAGLEESTVVIFTSDHGDMDAAHRMEHKTVFYEEAARVPLIVSHKGKTKPGAVDKTHLVSNGLDLLPTLCDYAHITPPADLPGRSFRPLAGGRKPETWREELVVENQIGAMLRMGNYKYCRHDKGANREMLMDLSADPGEMKNLASDSAHAKVLADLRRRLTAQLKQRKST